MPSDPVERLLSNDFALEQSELERDGFSERILRLLSEQRRTRLAIIGVVGAIGAAIAGAQFVRIETLVSPLIARISGDASIAGISSSAAPQLLAAAAIAAAFIATAIVLQAEQ